MSRQITECVMAELPVGLAVDLLTVSAVSQLDLQTPVCDLRTPTVQASAAVEDTRLIPLRPTTPFAASKPLREFIEESDEDAFSSAPPLNTLVSSQKHSRTVPVLCIYLRCNPDISALKISRYRYQTDISTLRMIYTFMTYFLVWSDWKVENQSWSFC